MSNSQKARLRVRVPIKRALEIAQNAIDLIWEEETEVAPGVKVEQVWTKYVDYYGNHQLGIVVRWGGRFFENAEDYCYCESPDPEGEVVRDYYKNTNDPDADKVEFREVFPEIVERTVYR